MNIRTTLRPVITAAAGAATILALAACSSGSGQAASSTEDNPYNLITPGEIRVGSVGELISDRINGRLYPLGDIGAAATAVRDVLRRAPDTVAMIDAAREGEMPDAVKDL